jgi:hypothetical protein
MQEDEKNIFDTGPAPSKDWFLQLLVNLANKNPFELDITLTVGGTLISGTLASVRQYFNDLGAYFASPFEATMKSEELKTTFKMIGDQCACTTPSEQTETPSYIHLKNARFFDATGKLISGVAGVWWRGRLSEVQGFSPGLMSEQR